jgi:hypothetical protein
MARHANANGDEAEVRVPARNVSQAVRRVREAVQQYHGAPWRTGRLHNVGAVPVVDEPRWVYRAAFEVPVVWNPCVGLQPLRYVDTDVFEDRPLLRQISRPVRRVERAGGQFDRNMGVPRLQRRRAHGAHGAHAECRHCQQEEGDEQNGQGPPHLHLSSEQGGSIGSAGFTPVRNRRTAAV